MPDITFPPKTIIDRELTSLIFAFLIVQFLFFIDEGYNDFRWMKEWGNWIVFGIYFIVFFGMFYVSSLIFFRRKNGLIKVVLDLMVCAFITSGIVSLMYFV